MEKLDLKDRKIIYELDLDSRQSFSQLGKKIGLHKDSVAYRVKKLQENGIIHHFETEIDFSKLGYTIYRYYFTYQFVTPEKRKEIIDYLVESKYSIWVTSLEGHYDLSVYMAVKDIKDYYHFWDDMFRKYGKYFSTKTFAVFCGNKCYGYSFLVDDLVTERKNHEHILETGGQRSITIDMIDSELLKLIATNSRIPIINLADTLNISIQTVNNRIKNLIKARVITGFRIELNFSKLEYKLYRLDINLNENVKKQPIINHLAKNPHTREIYQTIGDAADIEIEIIFNNVDQIHNLVESLLLNFPNSIKDYKYHSSLVRHKSVPIPQI
jgi:DNA-binding Lrp family transcriptional regulator